MKELLLLTVFLALAPSIFSQDISGNWVSEKEKANTLKNRTVSRFYEIAINKKMKLLEGKTKITVSWKDSYLSLNLLGMVDTQAHTLTLHTENFRSSADGSETNMKDGNLYKWTYTSDSTKEYLTLVLDEESPHIMLDSNIVFSRMKTNNKTDVLEYTPAMVPVKDTLIPIVHPVSARTNRLFKEIVTDTDLVKVDLYDVGEIDGDSVSLFLNGKLIASHQMLKASATSFTITLDKGLSENKLVLFAENLGSVPPNTAYMVITINKKEYTLNMQSDEQTNGEIVFRFAAK